MAAQPPQTMSSYGPMDMPGPSYDAPPLPPPSNPSYRPPPPPSGLSYPGESYIAPPLNPSSSYPRPPNGAVVTSTEQMPGPTMTPFPLATTTKPGLRDSRTTTESALREYMSLQRRRLRKEEAGIDERLRIQASTVLGDLRILRDEVAELVRDAESHRWRRFILGGAIASFVPIVKALFRRPKHERESSNDTEYAFRKSKSLVSRILDATHKPGIATVAFFVFAVMYVFQNEVSLRVARTVSKRLKRLSTKVENGEDDINEDDLKLLQGWRWRVLMWS
ncbi:hypothetical protein B0T17DRAFT_509005 [Bombardia bombarda]|uniref:Uncharacterized protein n=1 Tax=Bombardia bombarda TaxID=252184 RepID=A0AA39WU87_9PEZI|nr:hypothetical protein B0T17DRAFT_509005 [Bombardia bombarda]